MLHGMIHYCLVFFKIVYEHYITNIPKKKRTFQRKKKRPWFFPLVKNILQASEHISETSQYAILQIILDICNWHLDLLVPSLYQTTKPSWTTLIYVFFIFTSRTYTEIVSISLWNPSYKKTLYSISTKTDLNIHVLFYLMLYITLPSKLAATDSHSFAEISAATFFVIKWSFSFSSTGFMLSCVKHLLPTRPLNKKNKNIIVYSFNPFAATDVNDLPYFPGWPNFVFTCSIIKLYKLYLTDF